MSVYLDYNATAPIDPRVLETMVDAYKTIMEMRTAGLTILEMIPEKS